jgi:flagellar motor switch protein FliN
MADDDLSSWLIQEVAGRLPSAFESMGANPFQVSSEAPAVPNFSSKPFWWEQPLTFPPGTKVLIGAAEEVWMRLGSEVLTAAGLDVDAPSAKDTYLEVIGQICGAAAQSLGTRLRRDSSCLRGRDLEDQPFTGQATPITLTGEGGELRIWIAASLPQMAAPTPKAAQPAQASAAAAVPSQPEKTEAAPAAAGRPMDLLLDVEMPVSVSFGRAQLPLKDVIKLTSGSIVELNRSINEPVEVIINNCVIARGEVVVIEGNYGVRINQIVSRQERLRSLK